MKIQQIFRVLALCLAVACWLAPRCAHAFNDTLCHIERREWMDQYREFHRATRGTPDARYLVYYCGPGQNLCAGTGDRIRGMLYLMRVAAVHRMVFLAVWTKPANLTHFFLPNEINWTTEGLPADVLSKIGKEYNTHQDFFGSVADGNGLDSWRSVRVFTTTAWPASIVDHRIWNTTLWPAQGFLTLLGPLGGVPPGDKEARWISEFSWYIDISACWFQYAYRLSDAVVRHADTNIVLAYPAYAHPTLSYVAWHWRTGGQHGEGGIIRAENKEFFRSRLQQLMASINCARQMASNHSTPGAPILVVTDLNPMRRWIFSGAMGNMVTTLPSMAAHIDTTGDTELTNYLNIFADALILSRAQCLLVSQSGFSNTALMMRTKPLCWMHMDVCLRHQESFFQGITV